MELVWNWTLSEMCCSARQEGGIAGVAQLSPMHLLPTWRNKIFGLGALGKSCGKFQTVFLPPFRKSLNSTLN